MLAARGGAARRPTTCRWRAASCTCRCRGTTRRPRGGRALRPCRAGPTRRGARGTSSSSAASTGSSPWTTSGASCSTPATSCSRSVTSTSGRRWPRPSTPATASSPPSTTRPARGPPRTPSASAGAYLCVYGMEGPGGYQLVGRTVQMWNRWRRTADFAEPWLLRPFDQLRFVPVSESELAELRADLPSGRITVAHRADDVPAGRPPPFLQADGPAIAAFTRRREAAFAAERARVGRGRRSTWPGRPSRRPRPAGDVGAARSRPHRRAGHDGRPRRPLVDVGTAVRSGDPVAWIEAMKTETVLRSPADGVVAGVRVRPARWCGRGRCSP